MEEYTREQIQRADDTDLYVFLSGRCSTRKSWLRSNAEGTSARSSRPKTAI